MPRYAELVYNGFWFSPERLALQVRRGCCAMLRMLCHAVPVTLRRPSNSAAAALLVLAAGGLRAAVQAWPQLADPSALHSLNSLCLTPSPRVSRS